MNDFEECIGSLYVPGSDLGDFGLPLHIFCQFGCGFRGVASRFGGVFGGLRRFLPLTYLINSNSKEKSREHSKCERSSKKPFGVIGQICRISSDFAVEFSFFCVLLCFFCGMLAGHFFYNERNLLSAAIVGCGMLFIGFVWWLI